MVRSLMIISIFQATLRMISIILTQTLACTSQLFNSLLATTYSLLRIQSQTANLSDKCQPADILMIIIMVRMGFASLIQMKVCCLSFLAMGLCWRMTQQMDMLPMGSTQVISKPQCSRTIPSSVTMEPVRCPLKAEWTPSSEKVVGTIFKSDTEIMMKLKIGR